ncbi:hypothetical protein PFISCL1PPCAC_4110, partial [Pristionchus fissidentatus]
FLARFTNGHVLMEDVIWSTIMGSDGNDVYYSDDTSYPGNHFIQRARFENDQVSIVNLHKVSFSANAIKILRTCF